MPSIQGQGSSKVVACGGGGGTVTAATAAGTVTNISLVTLPASPTDAEYEVNIFGVLKDGTAPASGYGQFASVNNVTTDTSLSSSPQKINQTFFAGPGAVIAIPVVTGGVGSYQLSYNYVARRVV